MQTHLYDTVLNSHWSIHMQLSHVSSVIVSLCIAAVYLIDLARVCACAMQWKTTSSVCEWQVTIWSLTLLPTQYGV